jgi:membrane protease YdiL (CAAX protease family)
MNAAFTLIAILPFVIGILFANVAERRDNTRVLQYVYLTIFNGGMLLAGLFFAAVGALRSAVGVQTPAGQPEVDLPGAGLALIAGGVAALALLLPHARRAMARVFPIDAGSVVHATALSMTAATLGINLFQRIFLSPLMTPEGVAQLQEQGVSMTYADALVFPLLTLSAAGLLGVGLFTRRSWSEVVERLGLSAPKPAHVGAAILASALLMGLALGIDRLWAMLDPASQQQIGSVQGALMGGFTGLAGAFAIGITAGIGEELFFRGAYQPRFGILFTSVLFASFHVQYFLSVSTLIVLISSLVFGVLRQRTSLTASILAHFLYNFSAVLLAGI